MEHLHFTYQSFNYCTTIFIALTSLSIIVPQSSFHLPLCQLWCHNLHSTYHSFSYGTTIFIPCAKKDVFLRDYSNSKEAGRRKFKLYIGTRKFFFARGIIAVPIFLPDPPCCVMYSRVWFLFTPDGVAREFLYKPGTLRTADNGFLGA